MALISALFQGEVLLERAALQDAAHVTEGAKGNHVSKIQQALNQLDNCALPVDGIYGPSTTRAVLAFKKARNIVNRAYQSVPDGIVGKMTISALDKELHEAESDSGLFEVIVVTPTPLSLKHKPAIAWQPGVEVTNRRALRPQIFGAPSFDSGPIVEIKPGQIATIRIKNGSFRVVWSADSKVASITKGTGLLKKTVGSIDLWGVVLKDASIEVKGEQVGGTVILISTIDEKSLKVIPERAATLSVTVVVKSVTATEYVKTMVPHNHRPVANWDELLTKIEQPARNDDEKALNQLKILGASPEQIVAGALIGKFRDKPIAYEHLRWYLTDGRGQEFNENANIIKLMTIDYNFQERIRASILAQSQTAGGASRGSGTTFISQTDYSEQDFRFAFGTIELVSYSYDFVAKTFKVWFLDSYEFHPVCPGFYVEHEDDGVRPTNLVNAALVQLKEKGAADFWMRGEATFPLKQLFPNLD
jgi:hypothetical protein